MAFKSLWIGADAKNVKYFFSVTKINIFFGAEKNPVVINKILNLFVEITFALLLRPIIKFYNVIKTQIVIRFCNKLREVGDGRVV